MTAVKIKPAKAHYYFIVKGSAIAFQISRYKAKHSLIFNSTWHAHVNGTIFSCNCVTIYNGKELIFTFYNTAMKISMTGICFSLVILMSCEQNNKRTELVLPQRQAPKTLSYQTDSAKQWLAQHANNPAHLQIALTVNRTDSAYFAKMDSVILPVDMSGNLVFYLPFPLGVPYLRDIRKIIFFSYPTQTFAAYENGVLIYTGATNMGRKKDPTPTGLFYTNWKAEETTSTFNDEWELRWNFNIENKAGIGWHQYELPGYPASHSCLRLLETDARYLYEWADQWVLLDDETVKVKGTPVIVFGSYGFDAPKPWLQLLTDPHALDISKEEIEKITTPHLTKIIAEQMKREKLPANKK